MQSKSQEPAHAKAATPALKLVRFELSKGIEGREPVNPGSQFVAGSKVYAFLELANKGGVESALLVRFERVDSKATRELRLGVPRDVPRHRTFAFATLAKQPGTYRCVVTTEDGVVLAEKSFEVVAS